METPTPNPNQTIEFPRAPFGKRLFAWLFDLVATALLGSILALAGDSILRQSNGYLNAETTMDNVELSSSLYLQVGSEVKVLTSIYGPASSVTASESQYQVWNDRFETALNSFYSSATFFSGDEGTKAYQALKVGDSALTYQDNGTSKTYWILSTDNGGKTVTSKNASETRLYDFYSAVFADHAVPEISARSDAYVEASRYVFWSTFGTVLACVYLAILFIYFLVPLIFYRGMQTFGKKLFKLSVVDSHGLSPSHGKRIARDLLYFFVEFVLGVAAFGIPLLVSFTMFAVRKDGQCFHDYVVGTYVVDSSDETVYLNGKEYAKRYHEIQDLELRDGSSSSDASIR